MQEKEKINKIISAMKKAEELALKEINGKEEDILLVAAGLAAVTRNLYIDMLGPEQAQKVFEVMLDSFIVSDEIYFKGSHYEKPTIH
tara:strand:- start:1258 stop:1518 length:261 start_codon:yes stop_codon:yes gene_type:complete